MQFKLFMGGMLGISYASGMLITMLKFIVCNSLSIIIIILCTIVQGVGEKST